MNRTIVPVLCAGEILWDLLPDGPRPGGAPFNVAYNLTRLGTPAALLTRLGTDSAGDALLQVMELHGLNTGLVQRDAVWPTGAVDVQLDAGGHARYTIRQPAAWDHLALPEPVPAFEWLVYGTLAQRSPAARDTLRSLRALALKPVLDVNLRPPFDDVALVEEGLAASYGVKLNDAEMARIAAALGLPAAVPDGIRALAARFRIPLVCVTCGAQGAWLLKDGVLFHQPGFSVQVADTIGAGDAFLAGLLHALIQGGSPEYALAAANACGAFAAARAGALTPVSPDAIARVLKDGRV